MMSIRYCYKQNRSTEGWSKLKSPETRQVPERLVSTLEHLQEVGLNIRTLARSKVGQDQMSGGDAFTYNVITYTVVKIIG